MKLTPLKRQLKTITALGLCTGMLLAQPAMAIGKPFKRFTAGNLLPGEDKPAKKNKAGAKTRSFASLNNNSVKIYPDVIKRDMHVVAKSNDSKEIDFFVFDVEGTLIHHSKMKPKDHHKLSGLARGRYVYHVFCGDEETAAGNFEIR